VHGDGLADDEAIGLELADGLTGVGVGDFVALIRVEPDLALAAAKDGRRQALLSAKVRPAEKFKVSCVTDMARRLPENEWPFGGQRECSPEPTAQKCRQTPIYGFSVRRFL